MKKRGGVLLMLFEVLLTALVFFFMISRAASIGSKEIFYRNHLAKDVALTADAVQASPGTVKVLYGVDASDYTVGFKDSRVEVYQKEGGVAEYSELYKSRYGFVGGIKTILYNPKGIVFEKTKDGVVVNAAAEKQEG